MKALVIVTVEYSSNSNLNLISNNEKSLLKSNGFKGVHESEFNNVSTYVFFKIEECLNENEINEKYNLRNQCVSLDYQPSFNNNIDYLKKIGFKF